MNNKYDILIEKFEQNILELIAENDRLKRENQSLEAEIERKEKKFNTKLQEQQKELNIAYEKLEELNTEYENLLSTEVLSGTSEGRDKFKQFLEEMVKDIDRLLLLVKK